MQLSISVVTPSFNQGGFIGRTIESVLTQGVKELDYVVMDGGSTDRTLEILKRYENRLTFVSERDNGQAAAVNKGIRATNGDIIGWLNSDDIYYPGALALVLEYFARHPEADVVYGDAYHIDENDRILEPYYTEDWDYERLREVCFVCQPAVFFRRRLVEKAGLLDENLSFCMDYEYWLRLGKKTQFGRIRKTLAGSRMYKQNKTLRSRVAVHKEINDMFLNKMGDVPDKWIYAYSHAVLEGKGFGRDTPAKNFRFVVALMFVVLSSVFRWKHHPSVRVIKTLTNWTVDAFGSLAKGLPQQRH